LLEIRLHEILAMEKWPKLCQALFSILSLSSYNNCK
jgi:hypothetical protein